MISEEVIGSFYGKFLYLFLQIFKKPSDMHPEKKTLKDLALVRMSRVKTRSE